MAYDQLKLQNQLCFRLYTASRLITQAYEPYFKPLGITYTQYLVLMVLWEIKRMEKLGLVARQNSETDKRQQIVYLTQKGKDMKKKAAEIPSCMTNDFCRCGINPESMKAMIPILDELLNKLSVKEED